MNDKALTKKVSTLLLQLGVPPHIKGYGYLREAIIVAVKYPQAIDNMMRELYPRVADKFNITKSKVERGIRHAIDQAWLRTCSTELNKLLKITVYNDVSKPTSGEFIALIADYILMEEIL